MSNVYIVCTCGLNLMSGGACIYLYLCLRQLLKTGFDFSASVRNVKPYWPLASKLRTEKKEPFFKIVEP